jgi:putative methyltransferase (TIGR04325 family)
MASPFRRAVRRLAEVSHLRPREWEHVPEGWARQLSDPRITGWNVDTVRRRYEEKLPAFRRAVERTDPLVVSMSPAQPAEIDGSIYQHSLAVSHAYAIALAAGRREELSLLDWGGGIGLLSLLAGAVVPGTRIDYHCKDIPAVCQAGRASLPEATFHEDDSCLERRYDLVFASSSLQYAEDWQATVRGLAGATGRYLYVSRLPVVERVASFVVLQRTYRHRLDTECLSWVLNEAEFVGWVAGAGLTLVREFLIGREARIAGAPERPRLQGYLFSRTA